MTHENPTHQKPARSSRVPLAVHVALILAVVLYAIVAAVGHGDAPDANIGLGLASFGFIGLGLPWSLVIFAVPGPEQSLSLFFVAGGIGAAINLGLHYYLWRRSGPRSTGPATVTEK